MSDLRDLYQEVVLDHSRSPRNFRALPDASAEADGTNPLCGDRVHVWVALEGDAVREVSFTGDGCAISIAAASLLTELIVGIDIGAVEAISDGRLISALESDIKPSRAQCALLPLESLRAGLRKYKLHESGK